MRYAQLVLGPAGCGKSTYCSVLQKHGEVLNRTINVVNLDPAAEHFSYAPYFDVRDLVQLEDVMEAEDLSYGPNGGLVFCMEYLVEPDSLDWVKEQLGDDDDDYFLFDCPGQIELYTHMNVMQRFVKQLQAFGFNVCAVFVLDSQYMVDGTKFLSGTLAALSTMVQLEIPHVNILTKLDLLNKQGRKQLELFLEPEIPELLSSDFTVSRFNRKFHKLTYSLAHVIQDFSLVKYIPLDITDEDSISNALLQIDFAIQFGEDADVKTKDFEYPDPDSEDDT